MPSLSEFIPLPDEHAVIIGQTGSGKSTYTEFISRGEQFIAVFDPKDEVKWSGLYRSTKLEQLVKLPADRYPRICYTPEADDMLDDRKSDLFFRWVYARGKTAVYVDEVLGATEHGLTIGYNRCLTRGRSRYVAVRSCTQRPHHIPRVILTEARVWVVFRVTDPQDRVAIEMFSDIDREQVAALQPYEFLFYRQAEGRVTGPFVLDLGQEEQI